MFNFSWVSLILEEHCQATFVIAVLSARLLKCFGALQFCYCALQINKIQAFITKCLWFQEFYESQVCVCECVHVHTCFVFCSFWDKVFLCILSWSWIRHPYWYYRTLSSCLHSWNLRIFTHEQFFWWEIVETERMKFPKD